MKIKNLIGVHLALLTVNLIYAANFTIAKEVMPEYILPFGFIAIRATITTFLFWLTHALFVREKIDYSDLFRLALCGLFGVAINQMFFFWGLSLTKPINASIVMVSTPIAVLVISGIILRERLSLRKWAGILLGALGAVSIVVFGKVTKLGGDTSLGDLFVLINACSFALYLVLAKPLMKKYHPVTVLKWVFVFGMLYVLPFGYNQAISVEWSSLTPLLWSFVAYVIIGATYFAFLLNTTALKRASPTVVGAYIYLQPVFAGGIALLFGKDTLGWFKVICAAFIFIGVYLVSTPSTKQKT